MVTNLFMERHHLITKETMEEYCKGNYDEKDSVIDDLESFFEDIRLGEHSDGPEIWTYFLPKLTEEELKLIERQNNDFLNTFQGGFPDVNEAEMAASESDSKFLRAHGRRFTFTIENVLPSNSKS